MKKKTDCMLLCEFFDENNNFLIIKVTFQKTVNTVAG